MTAAMRQWDPQSQTCVRWVQKEIGAWVVLHDSLNGILQVRTPDGEKYVPAGWWITRHDDGTVTVSAEEPVA